MYKTQGKNSKEVQQINKNISPQPNTGPTLSESCQKWIGSELRGGSDRDQFVCDDAQAKSQHFTHLLVTPLLL